MGAWKKWIPISYEWLLRQQYAVNAFLLSWSSAGAGVKVLVLARETLIAKQGTGTEPARRSNCCEMERQVIMKYPTLRRCINGSLLEKTDPVDLRDSLVSIGGLCNGRKALFMLNRDLLGKGVLVLGATGTGKTAVIRAMGTQLRDGLGKHANFIVIDTKDDYLSTMYRPGDCVLCQGRGRENSVRWNLFEDLTYDGWDEPTVKLNCMEFSRQLFADKKGQTQQFFPDAAQLLLYLILVRYITDAGKSLLARRQLSNEGLKRFFTGFSTEQYKRLLVESDEAGSLRMMLGDTIDNPQALGVLGEEILTVLSTFSDVFGEAGDFSIRRFVAERNGKALFLRYDPAYRVTQRRLFGLLINQALKEALASSTCEGNTVLLCDELPAMGKTDLASAVNLGRAKGLICIAGLQSIEQLYEYYGEHQGNSLIAGLCNKLYFRPNDTVTADHIRDTLGKNRIEEIILSPGGSRTEVRNEFVAEEHVIRSMKTGSSICALGEHAPFLFHFQPPESGIRERIETEV